MARGRLTKYQVRFTQLVASGMDDNLAVIEAGYSSRAVKQNLYLLRRNKRVQERIRMLIKTKQSDKIASRNDREAFWTDMMNDPQNSGGVRLEASKLLGKAQGDFIIKTELDADIKSNPVVVMPELNPEEWEKYWEDNN